MKKVLYCVQKPCKRIINSQNPIEILNDRYRYKGKPINYFLSFPYCVFRIQYNIYDKDQLSIDSLHLCFSNGKKLFYPPFLNASYGYICLPDSVKKTKKFKTLKHFLDFAILGFWSSKFSDDIIDDLIDYKEEKKKIIDYNYWQKKTKKNPNWIPSSKSLVKYCNYQEFDFKFKEATKQILNNMNNNGLNYIDLPIV
ncbi:MAG: hypothetical protein EKK64_01725 [Neisseriaceae bacterium]|nr:MAG: hypothetical protein EKK64_01725 [Neisseriaceae bacterium]